MQVYDHARTGSTIRSARGVVPRLRRIPEVRRHMIVVHRHLHDGALIADSLDRRWNAGDVNSVKDGSSLRRHHLSSLSSSRRLSIIGSERVCSTPVSPHPSMSPSRPRSCTGCRVMPRVNYRAAPSGLQLAARLELWLTGGVPGRTVSSGAPRGTRELARPHRHGAAATIARARPRDHATEPSFAA